MKPSVMEEVPSHSYMLPELGALPLPLPTLSVPIRAGDSVAMMPSLNFQPDQYFAKAPAPSGLPRYTADMFVDSLLNDDANMEIGMGDPFVTEDSSSDDEVLQI
mmetsp:Transcript_25744/g.42211  ORF Transcript_25744/g.42211 Transcript_25744/m.42211 type:complete len:104 (-) Transcript_25744:275-586(-)